MNKSICIPICILICILTVTAARNPYPDFENPFGANISYHLNESSGTVAVNSIPCCGHGTTSNEDWELAYIESGLGAKTYGLFTNSIDEQIISTYIQTDRRESWSISFWYNGTIGANTDSYMGWVQDTEYFHFYTNNGWADIKFSIGDGEGGTTAEVDFVGAATELSGDDWHHVVFKHDGSGLSTLANTFELWIDGSNWTSRTTVQDNEIGAGVFGPLAFGGRGDAALFGEGFFDDILIFNGTLLTPAQILKLNSTVYTEVIPPTIAGALNVTVLYPVQQHKNMSYSLANLLANNSQIWVNGTHNHTAPAYCRANNSIWDNLTVGNGVNLAMDFNFTFTNKTAVPETTHHILVYCNASDSKNGTDAITIFVDLQSPLILPSNELENNLTIVTNGSLIGNINFTDNIELYSYYINLSNGTGISFGTNLGVSHYEANFSYLIGAYQGGILNVRACDAHTANKIERIDRIDTTYNGLKYVIEDRPMLLQDDYVHIYPKQYLSYATPSTLRKVDRYAFIFNRRSIAAIGGETFVVTSNKPIDISPMQHFGGHLIIPSMGDNGFWVDFANNDATKYTITRINANTVEVTVFGLTGTTYEFNSIGELNCNEDIYYFGNLNPQEGWTSQVLVGSTNDFYLNITEDPHTMSTITATLYYNTTAYSGGLSSNYTASATAPSTLSDVSENISWYWNLDIDGVEYNLTTRGQNVSQFFLINNSADNNVRVAEYHFINATDNSNLNLTIEFYANSTLNNVHTDYGFQTYDQNQSIYKFPIAGNVNSDIQIDYSTKDTTFSYFQDGVTYDNDHEVYYLYTQDDTTRITYTVYNQNDEELSGAFIVVRRWYVGSGEYQIIERLKTGEDGTATGNIILNEVWYAFDVIYNNNTYLTTTKEKVTTITKDFRINLEDIQDTIITGLYGLDIELTKDRNKKYFNVTWSDIGSVSNDIKLEILRSNSSNGTRIINSTKSTALTKGNLSYYITENTENQSVSFQANVYINSTIDDKYYIYDSDTIDFIKAWEVLDQGEAVLVAFIFIGTMALIGITISAFAGIILSIVGLIVAWKMGLIMLSMAAISGVIIICIILMVRIRGHMRI